MHHDDVAIGIVAYHPDFAMLTGLLAQLSGSGPIWLYCNAPLPRDYKADLLNMLWPDPLYFMNEAGNKGLGTAYNAIADAAASKGAKMLLLLDQDSSPPFNIAERLKRTFARLRAIDHRPALVGALATAVGEGFRPPREFRRRSVKPMGSAWPAEFVISSGSLVDLQAMREIGPFRDDFFVDAIDVEWCFRAQSFGYTCWIDDAVQMPHQLGEGIIRIPLLGKRLVKQSPSRLYTYVRNQIAMLGLRHVPWSWKARIVPHILLQTVVYGVVAAQRRTTLRAIRYGIMDGIRRRMGPGRRDTV